MMTMILIVIVEIKHLNFKSMKFTNFIMGIYITLSVILISLPYVYEYIPNETIYNWYCYNYKIIDRLTYINFIIVYVISSILFYINGYNNGKKKDSIQDPNLDK